MPSERVRRQIDRLLDDAEAALSEGAWPAVAEKARAVLAIDAANEDAGAYLKMAEANLGGPNGVPAAPTNEAVPAPASPETFGNGRYEAVKFLGEGGRKKVYLAKDVLLDRQVAFALIKTEGLDEAARERITREAQTMGRLGSHPNLVAVYDLGEHVDTEGHAQPFVVIELLGGGDVEGLLEKAGGPLPLERTLALAIDVCRGLEFIHGKGIVHRDLKPGNVWLTDASPTGRAKIGDYGLAMSIDRTRLTLQGTMVGTVDYMPPEQALGGEMTARSDLYSLGAMLYELVTGAPPFKGDRLTEVISQHINVAPEPPSARGTLIPRTLEELILRLLAKDPADRPASAAEVRAVLETIDSEDVPLLPDPSLRAQGVFVGRSRELAELKRRYDEAAAGTSRIVLLVGQPGIGKTRLARELEGYARSRGARVLWSRSPEASGAPPYWLLNQLLRRFLEVADEATARRLLGEDAPRLARIAPEVRERIMGVAPAPEDDSDFLTFEAMGSFLRRLAQQSPLVLLLDDLHWADRASLEWLQQLARELAQAPLLVLGTYRDTELSRTHPLAVALATLNREPNFVRVAVRGLDREQVADYLERTSGLLPSRELVDTFMRETDGNPFFLTEIVTSMLEAGTLTEGTIELEIPDGVREASARRVNLLSEEAVELLKLAAVCGYEFEFSDLASLTEVGEDRELELLEEALREHVIAEAGTAGRYRFVYQPMQRLLLEELSSARRIRLHGQIGERLEAAYGPRAEEHAAMLARHFSESAALNPAHRERALRYSWAAGQQAEAADELGATRWYERCLELTRGGVPVVGVSEADALAAYGRAMATATGSQHAIDAIRDAVGLFTKQGNGRDASLAALSLRQMVVSQYDIAEITTTALNALGDEDPVLEARLLVRRAMQSFDLDGESDASRASELATTHSLSDVLARLKLREGQRASNEGEHARAIELTKEALSGGSNVSDDPPLPSTAIAFRAGDLDAAIWLGNWESDVANSARRAFGPLRLAWRAAVMLHRREPDFQRFAIERGSAGGSIDLLILPQFLEASGDVARALRVASRADASPARWAGAAMYGAGTIARLAFELGDVDRARSAFARVRPEIESGNSWNRANLAAWPGAALPALLGPSSLADVADQRWETKDGVPLVMSGMFGSFDRVRAMWALALDRWDEAERLARRGLEWCVRERCPVEEGRCHQLLADVLRRKGDDLEAARHLDAATTLFQRHGARLYLDQALEQRALLKA